MKIIKDSQIVADKEVVKKWYRVSELSQYTGLSKSSIWNYARNGVITAYKFGSKCTVFNIDEVEQALLSKRGA